MTPEDQNQPQAPATGLDAFAGKAAEMLNMAVEHHKAGRLDVAETIYKQLAEMAPNNPDLAHLYGMLHAQKGLVVEGLEMIRKAIAMQPDTAVYYANLANVLMQSGRVGEAAAMLRQAAALRPEVSEYKTSLADALRQMGRTDEAEQAYRAVLKADPESETALINLGTLLLGLGRWKEAEKIYRRILEENPDSILVKGNFAGLLLMKGDVEEAIRLYREVLNSNPDSLDIRRNLTSALYRAMAYDEALAECEEVLRRNPGDVSALMMKGDLARERERFNEAEQAYRQVVADHPDHPMAHAALGLVRLAQGDYGQGWREYEWHWKADPFMGNLLKALPRPLWDGRDLEGRTLLVVCQHGLSDTMQFLRYIPRIAADKGGQVVVACHEDLVRLVRTLDGANQVVPFEKVPVEVDFVTPLASLPRLMETTPSTVPDNIPYLFAERAAAKAMAEELAAHGGRSALAVGLRWLDDRQHGLLGKNACPFTALKPILAVKDASFHSLQRGRPDKRLPKSIHNLARRLERFDDTAAALQALDLVITTDGAMAHLAGAMGRPVWLLLPKVPDGLWPLQGETTPWYPTMRLYRQEKAGDWQAPVARIARDLAALAKDGKSR